MPLFFWGVERGAFHIVGNTGFHFRKGIYWGMPNASSVRWAFQAPFIAAGDWLAAARMRQEHPLRRTGGGGVGSGRGRGVGFLGLLGFLGWAEKGDGPLWPPRNLLPLCGNFSPPLPPPLMA